MHLIENDLLPWNVYDLLRIIFQNSWTSFCNVRCFINFIILLQMYNPDSCSWEYWLLQWHKHKSHAWMKEYFAFVHSCIIGTFFYSFLLWMFHPTLSQMTQCLHGSNTNIQAMKMNNHHVINCPTLTFDEHLSFIFLQSAYQNWINDSISSINVDPLI